MCPARASARAGGAAARGALTGTPVMRRALMAHMSTYTLAFVPALIWLWSSLHAGVFWVAAVIAIPT